MRKLALLLVALPLAATLVGCGSYIYQKGADTSQTPIRPESGIL